MFNRLRIKLSTWRGIGTFPKGSSLGPRKLSDFEFIWMIEGHARYRRADRSYDAPEGAIVLCTPGVEEHFQWDSQRRIRHGYFHFDVRGIPRQWPAVGNWPVVRLPAEGDVLRPLFRHFLTWDGAGSDEMQQFTAEYILASFITGEVDTAELPGGMNWPEPVIRAWNHIFSTLNTKPNAQFALTDLARAACVSPAYLCRLFGEFVRHSPLETVRLYRLERAAWLMRRTNYSIGQIAEMFGYSDQFHFSRQFRQAYGIPPKVFQQNVRAGQCAALPRLISGMSPPKLPSAAQREGKRKR